MLLNFRVLTLLPVWLNPQALLLSLTAILFWRKINSSPKSQHEAFDRLMVNILLGVLHEAWMSHTSLPSPWKFYDLFQNSDNFSNLLTALPGMWQQLFCTCISDNKKDSFIYMWSFLSGYYLLYKIYTFYNSIAMLFGYMIFEDNLRALGVQT